MLKEIVELCFTVMAKLARSERPLFATHDLNGHKDDDLIEENRQVLQWKS